MVLFMYASISILPPDGHCGRRVGGACGPSIHAASVSGFVQHAVGVALDDVSGWGAMLAQALHESGGPMSADERVWADSALGVPETRRRSAA